MENFESTGKITYVLTWKNAFHDVIHQYKDHLTDEEYLHYSDLIEEMAKADPGDSWVASMAQLLSKKLGITQYQLITTYTENGKIFLEILFGTNEINAIQGKRIELSWNTALGRVIDSHKRHFTLEERATYLKLFEELSELETGNEWVKLMVKLLAKKLGFKKHDLIVAYTECGDIYREIVFQEDDSIIRM